MMSFLKKKYWIFLSIVLVALDQLTKYLVNAKIPVGESIEVIPQFFHLAHVRNEGAAMGILQGQRWIFMIFTSIVIVAAIIVMLSGKIKNHWGIVAVSLVLSGGIGNMIDRLFLGEVIDFFSFVFWGYEFYVFNVADIFVCCGVAILAVYILFSKDFDSPNIPEEHSDGTT